MMISKQALAHLRDIYKPGTRVELIRMDDPFTKLKPGDLGTASDVDDIGTISVQWDCGSCLGVVCEDSCRVIETNNLREGKDDGQDC